MLVHLFTDRNSIFIPFIATLAAVSVMYTARLIKSFAFGKCSESKYTYHALWLIPYLLLMLCSLYPYGYFSSNYLAIIFGIWLFSLICAIIQIRITTEKSWKIILEDSMEFVVSTIDCLKRFLMKIGGAYSGYKGMFYFVFIVVGLAVLNFAPQFAPILVIIFCMGSVFAILYECISSCKALLKFWFIHALVVALLIGFTLMDRLPSNIINGPLAYGFICVLLTLFWSLSAGIADYDVAKMAGGIINTLTTILTVAINVFAWWLQRNVPQVSSSDREELLYAINLAVLPVLAAGYISMLFINGVEYFKKRNNPQEIELDGHAELPEQTMPVGCASQAETIEIESHNVDE